MAKKADPKKVAGKVTPFDAADYLTTEKAIAVYPNEAFATGDTAFVLDALGTVARAKGSAKLRSAPASRAKVSIGRSAKPEIQNLER